VNAEILAEAVVGRFAPSPTGPLHFGSLVAAVGSYCLARQAGGRWLLRMEDLDTPRVVPGVADAMLRTLERLGFTWDGPVVYQSQRLDAYAAALEELRHRELIFPCACSRKEILASAPHPGEEGPVYPGTCRNGLPPGRTPRALRLRVPGQEIAFVDGIFGPCRQQLDEAVGDFVLKRADGPYAYQLAVVVDDAAAGVNQVVRGADLLASTPRQIYLHRCLELIPPAYWHLPLALDAVGEKISKRQGGEGGSPERDGATIQAVLAFLGQALPPSLRGAPARELLAWAVADFRCEEISTVARRVVPAW
jgi:glutamyl-Q tRNA(Asp) synthetase